MAKLVVLSEGFSGRTYELKAEKNTIGRLEDNSFHIPEGSVSSHHCEVFLRDKEVVVKDLNSTNGTFINGEKVSESVLKPGQILRLGQVELKLEGAAPAPATKKQLDQTRAIPGGVKLNEFEKGAQKPTFQSNSPFARKTNKANLVFLAVGVVLGLVIIAFLVLAFLKMRS